MKLVYVYVGVLSEVIKNNTVHPLIRILDYSKPILRQLHHQEVCS